MMLLLRFILLVMLWLSVFSNAVAQSPLDKDDRLNVAVTLHHHVISFSDLVRDLQKQTGVTMEVQRDIMDEKATVFVENKPAREVMEKLASVFLLRWERRKAGGYRLVPDADARKWERDFLALRERIADRLWLEWIQKGYRDVQRGRGWIEQRIEELSRREDRPREGGREEKELVPLTAERERLYTLLRWSGYLAAQVLGRSPLLMWARLKRGEIIVASTQPAPGELPLRIDAEVLQEILEGREQLPDPPSPQAHLVLALSEEWRWYGHAIFFDAPGAEYFEASAPELDVRVVLRFADEVVSERDFIRLLIPCDFVRPLTQHPLIKRWQVWQTPEESLLKEPALSTPFPVSRPEYPSLGIFGEVTDADLFCWFHTVTGIPVIMDGSRLVNRYVRPSTDTPARWLWEFTKAIDTTGRYLIRYEGGYVLARRKVYLDVRQREIPERLLSPIEAKVARGEPQTLDDYAQLAAQLSDKQVRVLPVPAGGFFSGIAFTSDIATRADLTNLWQGNVHMARFWASLSPVQKRTLWEGEPLAADSLSPTQKQMLLRILLGEERTDCLFDVSWESMQVEMTTEIVTLLLLRGRVERLITASTWEGSEEGSYSIEDDTVLKSLLDSPDLRSCRGTLVGVVIKSGGQEIAGRAFALRDEVLPPLDPPRCLWQETRSQSAKWSAEHDWVVHPRLFAALLNT
ncbi:hypothetical protein HRbin16_01710 [bacterium HR16]|nr:hypothetical protein HRbin16_01710 [bacterium HR16]